MTSTSVDKTRILAKHPPGSHQRRLITVRGTVQGVGFRPFVYRLANELNLAGIVQNTPEGVRIEVEGPPAITEVFLRRLRHDKPSRAVLHAIESSLAPPKGYVGFRVVSSDSRGDIQPTLMPDLATCCDCLREISDPCDWRFRYPFTNCTNCGPRFSIITGLPYDRSNTTMARFRMCRSCQREYDDPRDRRFHAQPNACPKCGPRLMLWDSHGKELAESDAALAAAVESIHRGEIVAAKGLGGFHLLVDATNDAAVERLRQRKHREAKPLAVTVPDLITAKELCHLSPVEERWLTSPEAPIVLLRRRGRSSIAPAVAPDNPNLGLMLPYTPLHHLLMRAVGKPIVATSGNRSDEPICTDENEAIRRLAGIADLFLVHDRPIRRHVDDSVVQVVMDRVMLIRRGRGFAPQPLILPDVEPGILAVGGHLKNTVAVSLRGSVVVSQHIGDLDTAPSRSAFEAAITDLAGIHGVQIHAVACDLHPDYASTQAAERLGHPVAPVQHHVAHLFACLAEHRLQGDCLGVVWDGTGFGTDGTVWGGEFFHWSGGEVRRIARFHPFRLPGGEHAVREPRRSAVGVLYELMKENWSQQRDLPPVRCWTDREAQTLTQMMKRGVRSPWTSSAGRLFDAVASLLDLKQYNRFEGEAAIKLEHCSDRDGPAYDFTLEDEGVVDWRPVVTAIVTDLRRDVPMGRIAGAFHRTLARMIVSVARRVGEPRVLLTGGCFQNRLLLESAAAVLRRDGFDVYWPQEVPSNDGGLALGQLVAVARGIASAS